MTPRPLYLLTALALAPACERAEVCDWKDNDQDGIIDEGFDADFDRWWACGLSEEQQAEGAFDCDDSRADVYPGAQDVCVNQLDEDCDSAVDEGCDEVVAVNTFELEGLFVISLDDDPREDIVLAISDSSAEAPPLGTLMNVHTQGAREVTYSWFEGIYVAGVVGGEPAFPDDVTMYMLALSVVLGAVQVGNEPDLQFDYDLDALYSLEEIDGLVYFEHLVSVDIDQDGVRDLVTLGAERLTGRRVVIGILLNLRDTFAPAEFVEVGLEGAPLALTTSRVDSGDSPDLLVVSDRDLIWGLQQPGGSFSFSSLPLLDEGHSAVFADLNGDPWLDVVVSLPRWRLLSTFLGRDGGFDPGPDLEILRHPGALLYLGRTGAGARLALADLDAPNLLILEGKQPSSLTERCRISTGGRLSHLALVNGEDILTASSDDPFLRYFSSSCTSSKE